MKKNKKNIIEIAQKSEIDEYNVYKNILKKQKNTKNIDILKKISNIKLRHYKYLKNKSKKEYKTPYFYIKYYLILKKIFGIVFTLRLLDKRQNKKRKYYQFSTNEIDLIKLEHDEKNIKQKHLDSLEEKKLNYISSIILGLNDALIEFTGSIAGFTFALGDPKTIVIAGIVSGISASLSMASSNYLSSKHDIPFKEAFESSLYTGFSYILTVIMMLLPYLIFNNVYVALATMIIEVIFIILLFNFYLSVAKKTRFLSSFLEMIGVSLSVALISFVIGHFIRISLNIDV